MNRTIGLGMTLCSTFEPELLYEKDTMTFSTSFEHYPLFFSFSKMIFKSVGAHFAWWIINDVYTNPVSDGLY